MLSRRELLLGVGIAGGMLAAAGLLGACGKAAAPSSGGSPSGADWDGILAAAKKEGHVSVMTQAGDSVRAVFDAFQNKYGIATEQQPGAGSPDLVPRVANERKAGQFSWDVVVHGAPALFGGFKQAGALDPLKSALVLPEVTDDANWIGGFDAGYADIEKSVDYAFVGYLYWCAYVNRDLVPEAALSKFEQLWDPRWKGKIAILDPRQPSAGAGSVAAMLAATNEDRLRAFFRDQQPVITQDRRQLAEWMIRGQYPIGLGQDVTVMQDFITQGVEVKQVQALVDDALGASLLSSSFGTVGVFDRPPHPNAAKVLVNWLLSREGQSVWSQHTSLNSRRTDVAPVSLPDAIVDPKKTYLNLQIEQTFPTYLKAVAIAKEELK